MTELELVEEQTFWVSANEVSEQAVLELHIKHGSQFQIEFPSPVNGQRYGLRSSGYVGHLDVDGALRLTIQPKTPIDNVFAMLEYAYDLPSFRLHEGEASLESVAELFEALARRLAHLTLDRVMKGLHRDYLEREDDLLLVKGRVQFAPTLRTFARGASRLSCLFEEQTPDLEDNQILAWTLGQLRRYRFENADVQRAVREAYRSISCDVSMVAFQPAECLGRFYDRLNRDYGQLHAICRFFLDHLGPHQEGGGEEFVPFLLSMPQLFEAFVARWLDRHLPEGLRARPQVGVQLDPDGRYRFDIDLVLEDVTTGRVLAVLDTKYKSPEKMSSSDVAQIVAYATSQGADRGALVYPTGIDEGLELQVGDVRVESLRFDLASDVEESGNEFLARLLDWTA